MGDGLDSIFPRKWIPGAIPPPEIILLYIDWMLQEVDAMAEERWPILKNIKGHRRMEVIEFLESGRDWTEGILNTKMIV